MHQNMTKSIWIPLTTFLLVFLLIPVRLLDGLSMMPGDIGDARLNNYFLENAFQFLSGNVDSLWHLSFFYPFPYVIGFSDNLFGSAPIYVLTRLVTGHTDTAFQIWFLVGYAANFTAAYYALRKLKKSVLASTVGALIFAFALPTTAHAGHAQLQYRFGLPLAIAFLALFFTSKTWNYLLASCAWLVWQFYAGIYMGFFTLLLMAAMSLTYLCLLQLNRTTSIRHSFNGYLLNWQAQPPKHKTCILAGLVGLALLLLLLFYPYLQVSHLYGAKRTWGEISIMLPRLESYIFSGYSFIWIPSGHGIFSELQMRHEHQMFAGLAPLILAATGLFLSLRKEKDMTSTLMIGMLALAVLVTLYVGDFSLWYILHKLPLASAIRAMTRIDQALLFPLSFLAAVTVDALRLRFSWGPAAIIALIIPAVSYEASQTSMYVSTKESWRQRISALEASLPSSLPKNPILFFAQRSGPPFADEIDAMWISLKMGAKTLNGYSGLKPPGYSPGFGTDCTELQRRLDAYIKFNREARTQESERESFSDITPVGFETCKTMQNK